MFRRWAGAAVVAGCCGLLPAARAQYPPPQQGPTGVYPFANLNAGARSGQEKMPEPLSYGPGTAPSQPPAFNPGGPATTPNGLPTAPGTIDPVSLPNDATGAFPTCAPKPEEACYFHIGYEGLFRQRLSGGGVLAVQDPQNLDTGNAPPAGQPVLQRLSDIDPGIASGVRGTLGLLLGDGGALEFSGFYLFKSNHSTTVADSGQIDSFFVNTPLGFEGDNGLFLQADRMTTTFSSTLGEAELNYRRSDAGITGADLLTGVRYTDLNESLSSYTDDDGIQFPLTNGHPDPTRVATYSVRTKNRLLGPQLGFEWDKLIRPYLAFGVVGKGCLAADFVELDRQLVRGDGFAGFNGHHNSVQFAQTYELNAFLDFQPLERVKLHVGYTAMWLVDVPTVTGEYDFNLQNTSGLNNKSGSIFFHGPVVELQLLF